MTAGGRRVSMVLLLALLGVFLLLGPPKAHAALACSATITDIDFGATDLLSSTPADALGTVTVHCNGIPSSTTVKMCPGLHDGTGGANASARLLTGPSNATLSYQLFSDASHTQPWGAVDAPALGTVPAMILSPIKGSATATMTIYARLFGSQPTSLPGSYLSSYAGAETAFNYADHQATSDCTGFFGTAVIHPEFNVSAAPIAGCSLITANLAFPATGVLAAPIAAQTPLRVTCTSHTTYSISLDNGHAGSAPIARKMTSAAGDTVTYGLYRDSAHTLPWGAAASGAGAGDAGTGFEQDFQVYGLVAAQITPSPGAYADTIVVTIAY
jgi:spore coat protein U-like protein